MRQFFILTTIFLALNGFTPVSAYSQEAAPTPPPVQQEQQPAEIEKEATDSTVPAIAFNEEKYVDPTFENLAHLYWALGLLNVSDNDMIDNFIAITECELYQTYVNNDLEWKEIRESTRKYLRENYKVFPTDFKITIPLYLGRYNTEGEYFEVDQKESSILAARKIETIYTTRFGACGINGEVIGYPLNLVLYLNRPFSLPQVPVEKELARLYLEEINMKYAPRNSNNPRAVRKQSAVRPAYLQLMFHVHSYKETIPTPSGMLKAVVYSQIDYIRVYADYEGEKILYEKNMFDLDSRARKKRVKSLTEEDLQLPDGPIFGDTQKKTEE